MQEKITDIFFQPKEIELSQRREQFVTELICHLPPSFEGVDKFVVTFELDGDPPVAYKDDGKFIFPEDGFLHIRLWSKLTKAKTCVFVVTGYLPQGDGEPPQIIRTPMSETLKFHFSLPVWAPDDEPETIIWQFFDKLQAETDRATAAEGALSDGLTAETDRAAAAEQALAADLFAETTRAQAAETSLQEAIDTIELTPGPQGEQGQYGEQLFSRAGGAVQDADWKISKGA
jgi:hypothetical protein